MLDMLINMRIELPDNYDEDKLRREIENIINNNNGNLIDYDIDET